MNFSRVVLLVFLASQPAFANGEVPQADTQAGMNAASGQRLRAAEAELSRLLEALESKGKLNPHAIAKVHQSQAAWAAYRDAQLQVPWAVAEPTQRGSAHPMCVADLKASLTEARVAELRALLRSQEGDVCASDW